MPVRRRWPGGSSQSNPTVTTHRERARQQAASQLGLRQAARQPRQQQHHQQQQQSGGKQKGKRALTASSLARHEAELEGMDDDDDIPQQPQQQQRKGDEAADEAAELSGPEAVEVAFRQIRRMVNSSMESHREACAVLAAITETVKQQGLEETPTAYWAALMSTLEHNIKPEEEKTVSAVTQLLSLITPHVPRAVLQSRYSHAEHVFAAVLQQFSGEEGVQSLVKSSMFCLTALLRAQDQAVWSLSSTQSLFKALLSFCVDSRAKVRKESQKDLGDLVAALGSDNHKHSSVLACAAFVTTTLSTSARGKSADDTTITHLLAFVKTVVQYFPDKELRTVCDGLMDLFALNKPIITTMTMGVFQALFTSNRGQSIPGMLQHYLTGLHSVCPAITDPSPRSVWNDVVTTGYQQLATSDPLACLKALPAVMNSLLECLLADAPALPQNAARNLQTLVIAGLSSEDAQQAIAMAAQNASADSPIVAIINVLASALRYRYQTKYKLVLQVVCASFDVLAGHCFPLVNDLITSLAELHETKGVKHKQSIEGALMAAARAMGVAKFLSVLPLDIDSQTLQTEFSRAWLIPLLKDNISRSELAYFKSAILPLAASTMSHCQLAQSRGQEVMARTYHTLNIQLWSLLPGFCTQPTDIQQSFKLIAKLLGTALSDRDELRPIVCRALQNIIKTSVDPDDVAAIAGFAKNYLPVLFNIYTTPNQQTPKQLILETIESFVSVADTKLLSSFFKNVIKKLLEATTVSKTGGTAESLLARHNMMDLALTMAGKMDTESIQLLLRLIKPQLQDTDATLQKKSYKALSVICTSMQPEHRAFVQAHAGEIKDAIVESSMSVSAASKQTRLKSISSLAALLDVEQALSFAKQVVAEVILGTKEVTEKARVAAFAVLVAFGDALLAAAPPQQQSAVIDEYFAVVMAGLAGETPRMISATILALARLVYQFHEQASEAMVSSLVETMTMLLVSPTREVVKSVLSFVKVTLAVLPPAQFEPHVPGIVSALVTCPEDIRRTFRLKTRVLFERLIRKFGFDEIYSVMPDEHRKLLSSIRKVKERQKKRQKEAKHADGDDEDGPTHGSARKPTYEEVLNGSEDESGGDDYDDDDFMDDGPDARRRHKDSDDLWIRGEAEDEPLDFLDSRAAQQISATKPGKKRRNTEDLFETDDMGRIRIEEEPESGKHKKKLATSSKRKSHDAMSTDEDEDGSGSEWEDLEDDNEGLSFGSGIHRDRTMKRARVGDDKSSSKAVNKKTRNAVGSDYRAKKAAGDVMKKGKPMPYAYLPLNSKALNKRKRARAEGEFKNMVKGAKEGVRAARAKSKKSGRR